MADKKKICVQKVREYGSLLTLPARENNLKKLLDPTRHKYPHILKSRRDNNPGINAQNREDEDEIEDCA
jgi:hypothetical protein